MVSRGDCGVSGSPRETFNPLARDLIREVFYKYLLSDYDRPSGLHLGLELGNGAGKAPDLTVRASRRER